MWEKDKIEVLEYDYLKYDDNINGYPNWGYVRFEVLKIDHAEQFIMYNNVMNVILDLVYMMKYRSLGACGDLPYSPWFVCGYHNLRMKSEARSRIYKNEALHEE